MQLKSLKKWTKKLSKCDSKEVTSQPPNSWTATKKNRFGLKSRNVGENKAAKLGDEMIVVVLVEEEDAAVAVVVEEEAVVAAVVAAVVVAVVVAAEVAVAVV